MERYVDDKNGQLYFTREVADKIPQMYYILVTCYSIIAITGISLVTRNDEYVKNEKKLEKSQRNFYKKGDSKLSTMSLTALKNITHIKISDSLRTI